MPEYGIVTEWPGLLEIVRVCDNSSIYNNSHQQAPVSVRVVACAGHTISDNEFATLGIVRENPDGSYEPLPENDPSAEWFYTSVRDERFDYYPSIVQPQAPETQEIQEPGNSQASVEIPPPRFQTDLSVRSVVLYIHCQAESGSSIRLRGVITRDTGEIFYTDSRIFDSSVTLFAQSAHSSLFPQDYYCTPGLNSVSDDRGGDDTYRISPRSGAFSFITLEDVVAYDVADDALKLTQVQRNRRALVATHCPGADPLSIMESTASTTTSPRHLSARITLEHPGEILLSARPPVDPSNSLSGVHLVAYDRQGNPHRISWADERNQKDAAIHTLLFNVTSHAFVENTQVTNIEFFKVKGLSSSDHAAPCNIYRNGYQTTYVDVVIRAVDSNSIPVDLTPAQLNSIVLVDYDTGAALSDTEWYIGKDQRDPDDLFDLFPGPSVVSSSVPAQGDQLITVWLKTTSRTNMEVAARIVLDDVTYHTYQKNVEPGGTTVAGKSNSSARVVVYNQGYDFKPEDFRYTGKQLDVTTSGEAELWKVSLKNNNYRICYEPYADYCYYHVFQNLFPLEFTTAQYIFRAGRQRTAYFVVASTLFYIDINQESAGYAVAAVTYTINGEDKAVRSIRSYLDQNGNAHTLKVQSRPGLMGIQVEWIDAEYYE